MEFAIKLPECPICKARCVKFEHLPAPSDHANTEQKMQFECGAFYFSEAKADFKDRLKNYGPWSAWKAGVQCSNATRIALELLRKQGGA